MLMNLKLLHLPILVDKAHSMLKLEDISSQLLIFTQGPYELPMPLALPPVIS